MPRSPEQNQAIREKRMQQILEAALIVFNEKGYHGAEMGAIARQAGLGRGLIYYYFKDKQDVYLHLIRMTLRGWKEEMEPYLRSGGSVADQLGEVLKRSCSICLEYPEISYFHQTLSRDVKVIFPDREQEVYQCYEENVWKPVRALIRKGVKKGEIRIPPELAERFFFSVLFGAVNHECKLDKSWLEDWVNVALYGLTGGKSVSVS